MKRLAALFMALMLLLGMLPAAALAQEVPVIDALDFDDIPPNPAGVHHYLLLCMDSWNAKLSTLGYSDGMVLVTVDEVAQRMMVTSFIRDMLVLVVLRARLF